MNTICLSSRDIVRNHIRHLKTLTSAELCSWRDEILDPSPLCGWAAIGHAFKWPFVKHELKRRKLPLERTA